jgi:hypothetical protein
MESAAKRREFEQKSALIVLPLRLSVFVPVELKLDLTKLSGIMLRTKVLGIMY